MFGLVETRLWGFMPTYASPYIIKTSFYLVVHMRAEVGTDIINKFKCSIITYAA